MPQSYLGHAPRCCFEIGVFLSHRRKHPEAQHRVEILPLFHSAVFFVIALVAYVVSLISNLCNYVRGNGSGEAGVGTMGAAIFVLCLAFAQRVRADAHARSKMEQQIAGFTLTRAECSVEADRELVTSVLGSLYQTSARGAVPETVLDETGTQASVVTGTAAFEARLRRDMTSAVCSTNLTSYRPSVRAFALLFTAYALHGYDSVSAILLVPDELLQIAHARATNQTLGGRLACDASSPALSRGAFIAYSLHQKWALAWLATMTWTVLARCFPQRRTQWANVASNIAASLLVAGAFAVVTTVLGKTFYFFMPCSPKLAVLLTWSPSLLAACALVLVRCVRWSRSLALRGRPPRTVRV